jgi:hypothetical protein
MQRRPFVKTARTISAALPLFTILSLWLIACNSYRPGISIYGNPDNDLYQLLQAGGVKSARYESIDEALRKCPPHGTLLVLAKDYPNEKTGYEPLLDKAKQAIAITMNHYPERWIWTNGIQQERARMILPLAWLVRVEDTPQHREWLELVCDDLLVNQVACGALREALVDQPANSNTPKSCPFAPGRRSPNPSRSKMRDRLCSYGLRRETSA